MAKTTETSGPFPLYNPRLLTGSRLTQLPRTTLVVHIYSGGEECRTTRVCWWCVPNVVGKRRCAHSSAHTATQHAHSHTCTNRRATGRRISPSQHPCMAASLTWACECQSREGAGRGVQRDTCCSRRSETPSCFKDGKAARAHGTVHSESPLILPRGVGALTLAPSLSLSSSSLCPLQPRVQGDLSGGLPCPPRRRVRVLQATTRQVRHGVQGDGE